MAKRKISTLLKATPGANFVNDPLLTNNLKNRGGNLIRVGVTLARDSFFSMTLDADQAAIYNTFNNGDQLLAGVDYVFESVATGNNEINFRADGADIVINKLTVENFSER